LAALCKSSTATKIKGEIMTNKFFVYGTLKIGGRFSRYFDNTRKSSSKAKVKGFDLYEVSRGFNGYPGIVNGDGVVIGEVHDFDDDVLNQVIEVMDQIEGCDPNNPERGLYRREVVEAELENGDKVDVNIYIYNGVTYETSKISSGNWELK
jgi:gamma-glutamylcyclotransferase (GGCT)/AIG2-like uncharacterized protein YtfP